MTAIINLMEWAQGILDKIRESVDFIGPLLLRIYLVPVFWVAANNKWNPFDSDSSLEGTIAWFEHSLELPFPVLNAYMAWSAEYFGAILLALGLATRWISIPLMFTMIVAVVTVHLENGWQALHDPMSAFAAENAVEAIDRLDRAKSILKEHGNYDWLTEHGSIVSLNNGIEFAATYFIMLLALFFLGGGKYISVDYWIAKKYK